ncbi:MAG: hypothetical protein AMXMBFR33_46160 [Candidatus Xenobia bacterium]
MAKDAGFRISCLDGIRALSVGLVVYDHLFLKNHGVPQGLRDAAQTILPFTGTTGVCFFFVISGYLITTLLLRERDRRGSISLRKFYLRRFLRIFPAFYGYLLLAGILQLHIDPAPSHFQDFLISGLYLYNLFGGPTHLVNHSWSLSIEEQYYLFWPAILILIPRRWIAWLLGIGIAVWPLLRVARHGLSALGDPRYALEVAAMDTILYGSLLALLAHHPIAGPTLRRWSGQAWPGWAAGVLLFAVYSCYPSIPVFLAPLVTPLRNACIVILIWWCINNSHTLVGRVLETRLMVHIGVISYSLYLWQQPFYGPTALRLEGGDWCTSLLLNLFGALTAAHLSYYFLEKPLLGLRHRLQ